MFRLITIIGLTCLLCACHQPVTLTGEVNGNFVYLKAPESGKVISLFKPNTHFEKGQMLYVLSKNPEQLEYDAEIQELIALRHNLPRDNAKIKRQIAWIAQVKNHIKHLSIPAKFDGHVFNVYYKPGDYVQKGAEIMSILPSNNLFVVFYVYHSNLKHLHDGDTVLLSDGMKQYKARVVYIAPKPSQVFKTQSAKMMYQVHAKPLEHTELTPGKQVFITFS